MTMKPQSRVRRRLIAGGGALTAVLALAGCGDEGQPTGPGGGAAGDTAAFCDATVDLESALSSGPDIDFETAPPEQKQAALEEYSRQVEPHVARAERTAPAEVNQDAKTAARLVRQTVTTGDYSALDSPEFMTANQNIDRFMLGKCGFDEIKVTGVNYAYEGIPNTIKAGTVAFTFINEGDEMHELGIARINDGVQQPLEQLLALSEEQAMQMVSFAGGAFATPGKSDTGFLELKPGRYGAACFVPTGSKEGQEGTGPPHFTHGMFAEFTVQ